MKKVVIDEAQDYSFFELYSLRHAFQTDLFTIVGDLAQGIYRYRGLKEWESLIGSVFQNVNYLKLQKTYRTTIEIMNLANELLELMPENLPKAEPVVRHGEKPQFINRNQGWLEIFKEKLSDLKASGMKSFAVVTKTQKEAALAAEQLDDIGAEFTMFDETQSQMTDRMVLPVYLAKGLEFDVVFLYSEGHSYQETTLDVKLLYVAMTRPLHRLFLIGENPEDFLLNHAHPSSFGYV